jgi:hypothetical protein
MLKFFHSRNVNLYGPNGDEVAALIEIAKQLKEDEIRQLAAVRSVITDMTITTAKSAAWAAARATTPSMRAAWFAWDYAADVARSLNVDIDGWYAAMATGEASLALVIKDLVGKHGFTQEHFDTLYGPWHEVIEAKRITTS